MLTGPFVQEPLSTDEQPIAVRELFLAGTKKRAFLVDNLFEAGVLEPLYEFFRDLDYAFADIDRADTRFARHLVHYFEEEEYETTPAIAVLLQQARAVLDDNQLEYADIKRIYANFNLFGDYQFAHSDGEDSWTALFFVNARWSENWGGEFLLFEEAPQPIALAVPPRPGRMVLFDGELVHRGGTPSKYCLEPRISVAIKFSRSA